MRLTAAERGIEAEHGRDAFPASGQPAASIDEQLFKPLGWIGVREEGRGISVVA